MLISADSANLLGVQAFKGDLDSIVSMLHRYSTMYMYMYIYINLSLLLDYNYGMWKYSTMLLRVLNKYTSTI